MDIEEQFKEMIELLNQIDKKLDSRQDKKEPKFKVGQHVIWNHEPEHVYVVNEIQTNPIRYICFDIQDTNTMLDAPEVSLELYGEKFTEDEKMILTNVVEKFNYLVRDKNDRLYLYENRPLKADDEWVGDGSMLCYFPFTNQFNSVQWTDDEPVEFRKYLED